MPIDVIATHELDAGLEQAWRRFQADDPDLRSPYFTPDFCRIVAEVRDDVRIAVISDSDGPVGFFPFHRQRFGRLAPLGGEISDYHGIIGRRGAVKDFRGVLKSLGAQVYDFNHTPASQVAFADHAYLAAESPIVDLTEGFEAWRQKKRAEHYWPRKFEQGLRKLERELGPVRIEVNKVTAADWTKMLDWKRASLAAMGLRFILDKDWAREVVDRVRDADTPTLAGATTTLWIGDRMAAILFGMRTETTWHTWFTSYDQEFARRSPGVILFYKTIQHASENGISELDMGRGPEAFKKNLATGFRPLVEGSVERVFSPLGATRRLRKAVQRAAARTQSEAVSDLTRRIGTRLLLAGRLA